MALNHSLEFMDVLVQIVCAVGVLVEHLILNICI